MGGAAFRHKRLQLDQDKLDRARSILEAKTETEAVDRALAFVVEEAELDRALKRAKGRARLKRIFR